jgi:hypothetical protein
VSTVVKLIRRQIWGQIFAFFWEAQSALHRARTNCKNMKNQYLLKKFKFRGDLLRQKKKKKTEYLCGVMSLESELSKQTYEKRVFAFFSVF